MLITLGDTELHTCGKMGALVLILKTAHPLHRPLLLLDPLFAELIRLLLLSLEIICHFSLVSC